VNLEIIVTVPRAKDPQAFRRTLARYLARAADETARIMKRETPALFQNLTNSVHVEGADAGPGFARGDMQRMVRPGVNYALMVATGTGPAAGRPRYWPRWESLVDLVRTRATRKEGLKWAKPGSKRRQRQQDEIEQRARALGRYIFAHGTKANPFHVRTAERAKSRCWQLLRQGVAEGLAAGGGAA
jgi:hypothetical protein